MVVTLQVKVASHRPLNVEVDQHKGGPGTKFGSDPTKTLSCKPKKGDWMDASVHGPRSTSPAIINCSRHTPYATTDFMCRATEGPFSIPGNLSNLDSYSPHGQNHALSCATEENNRKTPILSTEQLLGKTLSTPMVV